MKKIPGLSHYSRFILLAIVMAVTFSCEKPVTPAPTSYDIIINTADVTNGNLVLSDGDTTEARRGDEINWSINAANVSAFRIEKKGFFVHNIFVNPPGNSNAKNVQARIKSGLWFNYKYEYNIIWSDTSGTEHTYDPLISIKPRAN